ncbi:hypothetical protein Q3G72_006924 [Acer saccharum]|nr:hypothetical protein Q3G72_006924 [Acer saccharum]
MDDERVSDTSSDRQGYGGVNPGGTLNALAPDDRMVKQLPLAPDDGLVKQQGLVEDSVQLIGPESGPVEASNFVMLGKTTPGLGEGPNRNDKLSTPSVFGPAMILEGGGQGLEINKSSGARVGKRRSGKPGIEDGKRALKAFLGSQEEILNSSICFGGDSLYRAEPSELGSYRDGSSLGTDKRCSEEVGLEGDDEFEGEKLQGQNSDEVVTHPRVSLEFDIESISDISTGRSLPVRRAQ